MKPLFKNREEAATKLSARLKKYINSNALVLAVPRGGVEVGFHIARQLNLEFSIIISKKIPHPQQPELAIGAVSEEGTVYFENEEEFPKNILEPAILRIRNEILRRVLLYRDGKPLPVLKDRTIILVDDGIATGATLASAILVCLRNGAKKVVVAVPVAAKNFAKDISKADELVILYQPVEFNAVGEHYHDFEQLTDAKVISLIRDANTHALN